MKKLLMAVLLVAVMALFVACGESTTEDKKVENVETEETSEAAEEEAEDDAQSFDQVIADNENIKATLLSVTKTTDDIWGDSIEVTFEVENKREDTIEVQAREVSADGKMVDDMLLSMSTEVAGGKIADATLTIQDYEGGELPAMEENLEMILHIFSWDDMDYTEDHPVLIEF